MSHIHSKAVLFESNSAKLSFENVELPTPQESELIVEIDLCTICGSDLHTIEGRRPAAGPMVLGHEIVGRVALLPESGVVDIDGGSLQIGDRITWSLHASCGACFFCLNDLSQKCTELFKYGHQTPTAEYPSTGGFATHCQLRRGTSIIRLPESLTDSVACPANCATATVAAAFRQAPAVAGKSVLILGAGMLGLTAIAWAHAHEADSIVVVEPNTKRADLAESFGASAVVAELGHAQQMTLDFTDGRGADVAFDFCGRPDTVLASIHFLRTGGAAILVGSVMPTESISISPEMLVRGCLNVTGVHNYLTRDLQSAIDFLVEFSGQYPFADLVSSVHELTNIEDAIKASSSGDHVRVAIGRA